MIPIVICDATTNGINLYKQLLHSCPNIHIAATANSSESLLALLEEGVDACQLPESLKLSGSYYKIKQRWLGLFTNKKCSHHP